MNVVSAHTILIAADHPAYAGHFPGAPLVPGALLLDEVLRAIASGSGTAPERVTLAAVKFTSPVRPGERVTLRIEMAAAGRIRFELAAEGRAVAHGTLAIAAGAALGR